MRTRPTLIATTGLALTLALAGCASTTDTATPPASAPASAPMTDGSTSPTAGSDTDIAFAQLMIPHHQQAIQMADLAATNATSAEVKALAAQIKAAQDPEISRMSQWLGDWGAPMEMEGTTDGGMDHGDMDMGGMTVAGMMSAEDMDTLGAAAGADFDTMWLQMMIAHHQGAIAMAQQVADTTTNPAVQELADAIIAGQTTEITTMQQQMAK
jgi:uncharacterized protein (DUF305 family)